MESRWRTLVDAGIAVTSELSLAAVLQKIVEAAAQLTGARYAALGVIDPSGRGLEQFLTTGIDPETHDRIGDLPQGRGILGVLIHDAKTLRLHDLTANDSLTGALADTTRIELPPADVYHHAPLHGWFGKAGKRNGILLKPTQAIRV